MRTCRAIVRNVTENTQLSDAMHVVYIVTIVTLHSTSGHHSYQLVVNGATEAVRYVLANLVYRSVLRTDVAVCIFVPNYTASPGPHYIVTKAVTVDHPVSGCAFLPVVVRAGDIRSQTAATLRAVRSVQFPRSLQYHVAHVIEVQLSFKILLTEHSCVCPSLAVHNSGTADICLLHVAC